MVVTAKKVPFSPQFDGGSFAILLEKYGYSEYTGNFLLTNIAKTREFPNSLALADFGESYERVEMLK